jgi:putative FmdB family regulatory protein
MAVYEYQCPKCRKEFELMRPISEADKPARCPKCGSKAVKLISGFASKTGDSIQAPGKPFRKRTAAKVSTAKGQVKTAAAPPGKAKAKTVKASTAKSKTKPVKPSTAKVKTKRVKASTAKGKAKTTKASTAKAKAKTTKPAATPSKKQRGRK